jgi:hypothetical protein
MNDMVHDKINPHSTPKLLQRHIALPTEHGAWVFLFSPLLIGIFAAGNFRWASLVLVLTALAAFLMRQPLTIAVKVYSRRRPKTELAAAWFWLVVYGALAFAGAVGLILLGHSIVLWLALPALPVLAWYLWLISKRSERRQAVVEIAASGILALGAAAAYWIGLNAYHPLGWILWALCWLQAAGSILYVYLRLHQRRLPAVPSSSIRWQMARPALTFNLIAVGAVIILALIGAVSGWLVLAFGVQFAEALWGAINPAVKAKPTAIGVRQLVVSSLFTLLFILAW